MNKLVQIFSAHVLNSRRYIRSIWSLAHTFPKNTIQTGKMKKNNNKVWIAVIAVLVVVLHIDDIPE